MTAELTPSAVTALLYAKGWIPRKPGGADGFTVGTLEGGVLSVEYHPGQLPIDPAAVLTAMAERLAAQGWLVTDNGRRILVSEV